jgi:endonuclease/exonuclease/phosphatase family metal-dependent hydrolase
MCQPGGVRVVTFNAGLIEILIPHAVARRDLLAGALPALGADVLALQEVWEADDLEALTETLAPTHTVMAADPLPAVPGDWVQDGRCGVVLATSLPVMSVEVVPLESFLVRRAAIVADVETPRGEVRVIATHLAADIPPVDHPGAGGWEGEHRAQVETVVDMAGDGPVVLAGDLNCSPTLPGLRGEFEAGYTRLVEAFPRSVYVEQGEPMCTFCSSNPLQPYETSTLIDHVLAAGIDGPATARRILDEPVAIAGKEVRLSDHYGLETVFEAW